MSEDFRWYDWQQLDPDTLYTLLKLRSDIFVVEQNCVFSDMDGLDPACAHLVVRVDDRIAGCARLVPPVDVSSMPAIGRVVVAMEHRGTGLGRRLMQAAIAACQTRYPEQAIFLCGQQHLEAFYRSLGFDTVGEMYLEDGIPHVDMIRPANFTA